MLCGHIICADNNSSNYNIANNNKKKEEEDEDESAHLPAGTPTGCVSSSPAAEADGEGGNRGGEGERGGTSAPPSTLPDRNQPAGLKTN